MRPLFWLIFLLGIALRAPRLDFPPNVYFDEKYYVGAAQDYLANRDDANNVHPPMAKLQIAFCMLVNDAAKASGYPSLPEPVGWRLASFLAGMGTIWLSYKMALTVTGKRSVALIAMFLVATDFLQIVESRITMLDQVQTFWITLGLLLCAQYRFQRRARGYLWGAGLAFGVATACKWNGLFAAFGGYLIVAFTGFLHSGVVDGPDDSPAAPTTREVWKHRLKMAMLFAFTILTVYAASYTPFLAREGVSKKSFDRIVGFHDRMVKFRYDPNQFKHRYISQFYEWPLVLRPIWLYYEEDKKIVHGVVAFGSVLFWWPSFFLLLESAYLAIRRRDRVAQFLTCAYFPQWLFWASSTTGGFIYYMLPCIPMMAMALARHLQSWAEEPSGKWWVVFYLVCISVMLAVYYPLLTGLPIAESYFRKVFFINRWI